MVVRDFDAALNFWADQMKDAPWIVFERASGQRQAFPRGAPTAVEMLIAFSYSGETQLEIICQTNSAPSP